MGGHRPCAAVALAVATFAVWTNSSAAAKRIRDGGFENQTTCTATDCRSTVWSEVGPRSFLCDPTVCPNLAPGPAAGTHWARIGGGFLDSDTGAFLYGGVAQAVRIPAGPATLRFRLKRSDGAGGGAFIAKIDGNVVYTLPASPVGNLPYFTVTVDVSQFAGADPRLLILEVTCQNTCNTFDIDDVSLDAPDPPASPTPSPTTPVNPPTTPAPTAPTITRLTMLRRVFRVGLAPTVVSARARRRLPARGSAFRYTLSQDATVRIAIARRLPGRLRNGRCVRPTSLLISQRRRRCTRLVAAGTLTRRTAAGRRSTTFSGRIGTRALPPGLYRATLTATNSARLRSAAARIGFRIATG